MNEQLVSEMLDDLRLDILPYWMDKMIDPVNGGFYGRRNGFDELEPTAAKGIILNTRILWTFASAARTFKEEKYLAVAERAFHYIESYFFDKKYGGVYWMVDYTGYPIETKKQIYAQAFAIYAYTEFYLASGNKSSLSKAVELYELIEKYSFDDKENGYLEAFDEQWNLLADLRLSDKDANEKKTMNTHLHILEAYTVLYAAWKNEGLKKQLENLIRLFIDKIINQNYRYDLFFNEHWELQSSITSFGHDIEGSWLLLEAAKVVKNAALVKEVEELAIKTVDKTIADGLDEDGGIMNETEPDSLSDTDKHWWPQAEAIVGLVNAWQITQDKKYIITAKKVWDFVKNKVIDREQGEWHWLVKRDGTIDRKEDKAGPWKCPYHNGRAAIEVLNRLRNIVL